MDPQDEQEQQKPAKAYGKRSMGQWLLIYIVLGAIVYGLIYYFFMRGDNGGLY